MIRLHTHCLSSSTSPWVWRAVEEFRGGRGGGEQRGYISSYEQLILSLLSLIIFPLTYNSMNKGQSPSYTHLILHSNDNPNDLFPASALPRGWSGENLKPALLPPPIFRAGWGWGCGWLGPPLSFVLTTGRVGVGGKGQPLQMTNLTYFTSYLCSQDLSSLTLVFT